MNYQQTSGAFAARHTNIEADLARRFLKLLGGSFMYQTFQDRQSTDKDATLAHVIPGPAHAKLLDLHAHGAGIFVTVNETNGEGRRSEHITRVRAVWQEDDGLFQGRFPLEPSMVVETSPGHFHRYWLVSDEWPADERGRKDFDGVLDRMVESYGSDKGAKSINRVLRVPGFLHRKTSTTHLVRIVGASARRYTRKEILEAFPPIERKKEAPPLFAPRSDDDRRVADALNHINADDRDVWLECGMAIKDHFGDAGRDLWDNWSRRSDKYDDRDQEKVWRSFRGTGVGLGTLFHRARQGGWEQRKLNGSAPPKKEKPEPSEPVTLEQFRA